MKRNQENQNLTKSKSKHYRTREFTVITYLFFAIFIGMVIYFICFLGFTSENFINSPYNSLSDLASSHIVRGDLTTSDGTVIATTVTDSEGNESRYYPYGRTFAHVCGYSINGKSGLENQMNFYLLRSHSFFLDQIINDLKGEKNQGDTVVTTLDMELQQVAYQALGDFDGAVVVLEPSTGKILAMVSKPDYDPNSVAENWEIINADDSTVLYNRATQGQYAPGSVFKIFTTLEYIRENDEYDSYNFDCTGEYTSDGKTIHCAGNKVHGTESLIDSFANSCNSSYANLALSLDQDKYMSLLNNMLFNSKLPIDFVSNSSKISISNEDSSAFIMETGIGQGNTYVSPLHMAMIAGAINQDGIVMKPYLIDHVENDGGSIVKTYKSSEYKTIMTEEEADILEEMMAAVVDYGTGSKLKDMSYRAYGKTGTAQVSDSSDQTNAWFVGYASKEGYSDIAVAVIVENSGAGSTYAVPIAQKLFDAYFN